MFLQQRSFLLVFLLCFICQTITSPDSNSLKIATPDKQVEKSETGIWSTVKGWCNGVKKWAFGQGGFFTDFWVRTGEKPPKSSKQSLQRYCFCNCRKTVDQSANLNRNLINPEATKCQRCSKKDREECVQYACTHKQEVCEDCCVLMCCDSCQACGKVICGPVEVTCDKVLCSECMLETYRLCWKGATWPCRITCRGIQKVVEFVCCCNSC